MFNFRAYDNLELDEQFGVSVFYKDNDGAIYHTYRSHARSVDPLSTSFQLMDLLPKGRGEERDSSNTFRRA